MKYLRFSFAPVVNMFTEVSLQPLVAHTKEKSQENYAEALQDVYSFLDELTDIKRTFGDKDK